MNAATSQPPAPIIVTAMLAANDFAWFDRQRRANFPPERNQLAAHLTLFHALPPSILPDLERRLVAGCRAPPPRARVAGLINLGRGVAYRIDSAELDAIRAQLAEAFADCLTPQDRSGFRAHITIQNKVEPAAARALLQGLSADFAPRPIGIAGLECHWYRGGPWEPISAFRFRGATA